MAQKKQITQANARKRELITQLAEARQSISQGKETLKSKLNIKNQLQRHVVGKPKAIFAGSAAAGLLLTMFLKRPKKPKKRVAKTARQILLTWGLSLVKPTAKAWLVKRAKKLAAESFPAPQQNGPYRQISAAPTESSHGL